MDLISEYGFENRAVELAHRHGFDPLDNPYWSPNNDYLLAKWDGVVPANEDEAYAFGILGLFSVYPLVVAGSVFYSIILDVAHYYPTWEALFAARDMYSR